MWPQVESIFGKYKSAEFALIILKDELLCFVFILKGGMYAGDWDVFWDLHIDVFFATDLDDILLLKRNKLENSAFLLLLFLHYLQH